MRTGAATGAGTGAAAAPGTALRDARAHLDAELAHLDLLLLRELGRFERAAGAVPSHQGIYITAAEVEHLLTAPLDVDDGDDLDVETVGARIAWTRSRIDAQVAAAEDDGTDLPLSAITRLAGLTATEALMLVACVAPELDRRYDRVYAYLQDDLARRRPSVDLVCRLATDDRHQMWQALGLLSEHSTLLSTGLLRVIPDPASPSGSTALSRLLQVGPSVVAALLGRSALDPSLAGAARLIEPGPPLRTVASLGAADPGGRTVARLLRILGRSAPGRPVVVHLHGAPGAGQAGLARAVAGELGSGHVELRCAALPTAPDARAAALHAAVRDAWLAGRPLLLLGADAVLRPESGATREQLLDTALRHCPAVVLTTGDEPWPGPEPEDIEVHQARLDPVGGDAARVLWQDALSSTGLPVGEDWAARLAHAVRLGPATVEEVAREVRDAALGLQPATADFGHWLSAARRRATRQLDGLARLVPTGRGWDDLVLDDDRTSALREICDYVRLRDLVLGEWGMAARAGVARGLSALFAGPPGTGKTMSAGVIAAELGLELFVIDLSEVVSKYIGETEKNLARVFDAAENSGAVLLFDEADALFGTRTQISDAHDRYANVETSYLLQRMEDYDGVAVLSSNLRQNMDEAFLRRLRFVVDFPLPDQAQRRRIWERHIGGGVPLADLDLDLLAARLPVAGGSIRNIALAGAFFAAAEREPLGMHHLARASRREYEKLGKLWRDPLDATQPPGRSRDTAAQRGVAR